MSKSIPLHEGLFTWPADHPQLLGARCPHCGEHCFPAATDCRHCGGRDNAIVELGDRGTLWTWTIQGFMPKPPYHSDETADNFTPYGVGYVEMPCGLRVEARLKENQPEQLRIGMSMALTIETLRTDANGNELLIFAFQGVEQP